MNKIKDILNRYVLFLVFFIAYTAYYCYTFLETLYIKQTGGWLKCLTISKKKYWIPLRIC